MFFLVGPTGVGKSDVAVALAERCGAEIVGADAFQVYEGMDILTAKPSPALLARVPHHLIGCVALTQSFDAAQYRAAALTAIADIRARGRLVLIAGGTGLYVRALCRGLDILPGADAALRAGLNQLGIEELQTRYRELDPAGASRIDLQNPRRLIRAIEVCVLTGKPFSTFQNEWKRPTPGLHGALLIRDRAELYERIDRRTEAMFRAGLLDEVRRLGTISPTASQAIGLRDAQACLHGEITEAQARARIQQASRRYAKRQLTWFHREPTLREFNLSTESHLDSIVPTLAGLLLNTPADD